MPTKSNHGLCSRSGCYSRLGCTAGTARSDRMPGSGMAMPAKPCRRGCRSARRINGSDFRVHRTPSGRLLETLHCKIHADLFSVAGMAVLATSCGLRPVSLLWRSSQDGCPCCPVAVAIDTRRCARSTACPLRGDTSTRHSSITAVVLAGAKQLWQLRAMSRHTGRQQLAYSVSLAGCSRGKTLATIGKLSVQLFDLDVKYSSKPRCFLTRSYRPTTSH
mmetsp:Transcript_12528/g.32050  ORF Transcript_12528/g.32050 Transcript_12528/m.32050 type:complete len:219 (-) Transcript_12528:671-1327(-)